MPQHWATLASKLKEKRNSNDFTSIVDFVVQNLEEIESDENELYKSSVFRGLYKLLRGVRKYFVRRKVFLWE